MTTVTYSQFANGRAPFASVVAYATTDVIAKHAKKIGKLASKGIDAEYDAPRRGDSKACTGSVFAGDRRVARFTVTDEPIF